MLKPESCKFKSADFLLIAGAEEQSYATANEAFCQIMAEAQLYVPASALEFLSKAVEFCNTQLLGTLGSAILIDEDTKKTHRVPIIFSWPDGDLPAGSVYEQPFIALDPLPTFLAAAGAPWTHSRQVWRKYDGVSQESLRKAIGIIGVESSIAATDVCRRRGALTLSASVR